MFCQHLKSAEIQAQISKEPKVKQKKQYHYRHASENPDVKGEQISHIPIAIDQPDCHADADHKPQKHGRNNNARGDKRALKQIWQGVNDCR